MAKRFFITGLPRSGTTWLMNLMNAIPGVTCFGEGKIYATCTDDVPSLYALVKQGISEWVRFIAHRKNNVLQTDDAIHTIADRVNVVSEEIIAAETDMIASKMVRAAVDGFFEGQNVVGEKTPVIHVADFKRLVDNNPDALIIFLQRDVYDWIVSWACWYYERRAQQAASWECFPFGDEDFMRLEKVLRKGLDGPFLSPDRLAQLAHIWSVMQIAAVDCSTCESMRLIAYRHLYDSTAATLTSILSHFGKGSGNEIRDAINASAQVQLREGAKPGANKALLSEADIAVIDKVIGRDANALGN